MAKYSSALKALIILISLLLISLILTNLGEQNLTEPFFFGGQSRPTLLLHKPDTITPLIQRETADVAGSYAIYIKDLKTDKSYGVNINQKYPAASLYKLAVMYKAFDSLSRGEITKEELVSQDKVILDKTLKGKQNIEETLESSSEVVSHTFENALNLMITISDNYSAILLADKLGWRNINEFMQSKGLAAIDLVEADAPTVTARATGDLLEQIYSNKAVSTKASEEMKRLLFAQKVNDRIPKYLPRDIKVGHKTGELGGIRHDAGIILGKRGHYIFVFLSDTPAPQDASEEIALLSRKIFDELEK